MNTTTMTLVELAEQYLELDGIEAARLRFADRTSNVIHAGVTEWDTDNFDRYTTQYIVTDSVRIPDNSPEFEELMDDLDMFEMNCDVPPIVVVWYYSGDREDEYQFNVHYALMEDLQEAC